MMLRQLKTTQMNNAITNETVTRTRNNNAKQQVCLEAGVANLGCDAIKIEMCEGAGWITHNGCDIFVYSGQEVELGATSDPILVSPLHTNQRIVFNIASAIEAPTSHKSNRRPEGIWRMISQFGR